MNQHMSTEAQSSTAEQPGTEHEDRHAASAASRTADAVATCAPDVPALGDAAWAKGARRRAARLRHRAEVLSSSAPSLAPLVAATKRRASELELLAAVIDDRSTGRAAVAHAA